MDGVLEFIAADFILLIFYTTYLGYQWVANG